MCRIWGKDSWLPSEEMQNEALINVGWVVFCKEGNWIRMQYSRLMHLLHVYLNFKFAVRYWVKCLNCFCFLFNNCRTPACATWISIVHISHWSMAWSRSILMKIALLLFTCSGYSWWLNVGFGPFVLMWLVFSVILYTFHRDYHLKTVCITFRECKVRSRYILRNHLLFHFAFISH